MSTTVRGMQRIVGRAVRFSALACGCALLSPGSDLAQVRGTDAATQIMLIEVQLLELRGSRTEVLKSVAQAVAEGETLHSVFSVRRKDDVEIAATLVSVLPGAVLMRLRATDGNGGAVWPDRSLRISDGEAAVVDLAAMPGGTPKMVLRLAPSMIIRHGLREFAGVVPEFGVVQGIVILDLNEVLSRSSVGVSLGSDDRNRVQSICLEDPRLGLARISYRRFPGSELAGYIENRALSLRQ